MRIEANLRDVPLDNLAQATRLAEALGFDGLAQPETRRDPFIALTLASTATERIRLATAVAIAFPRSPMVVAYAARALSDISGGRFALGIGTQVKGHIERRFSTVWDRPGPRLREYVLALRAICEAWQHATPLDFQGEFYRFTLMSPEFDPGPSPHDPVPIHVAALNRYLVRTAGEIGDGMRAHAFTTPEFLRDVVWPNVQAGATRACRSLQGFEMIGGGLIATGADDAAVSASREAARRRIALYASTRTYLPLLEHHGSQEITPRLRALIDERRWDDLPRLVSDEMLDSFCISGTYATIADAINARYAGVIDTLSLPFPHDAEQHADELADTVGRLTLIEDASVLRR